MATPPSPIASSISSSRPLRPHVMASRVRMVFRVDATAALRACDVPILYIAGANDYVVPRRNLRLVQRINSRLQSVTIDAPHMVLQTRPNDAAGIIAQFASSLGVE